MAAAAGPGLPAFPGAAALAGNNRCAAQGSAILQKVVTASARQTDLKPETQVHYVLLRYSDVEVAGR
jgi:hypothetical protein